LEALDYFVYLLTAIRHHCSLSRRVSYKYVSVARAPKQTLGRKSAEEDDEEKGLYAHPCPYHHHTGCATSVK
jgi:hypothetical protein